MTFRDLRLRLHALLARRRVDRDLHDELAFHVDREIHRLAAEGVPPAEARRRALAEFGSVAAVADDCRDARGTSVIETTIRDVLYAFRTFRRAPLAALTIVATVALGLGLVAVAFTFLNVFLFRVDEVPRPQELFAVGRPRNAQGEAVRLTRLQYDALRRETTVFTDASALLPDIDSRIDGRRMNGALVTGNFFQMTGVRAVMGRALEPDDEAPGRPAVLVLSHRGWMSVLGSDPRVLERQLVIQGRSFQIVGVMPDGFRGLDVSAPDYWAPLSLLSEFRPAHRGHEDQVAVDIVGRLRPGVTRAQALAGLAVWDAGQAPPDSSSRAVNITLEPRQGTIPRPAEALMIFTPLFFAFGLILLIGCANVANLLLARAVARQHEIGIRLSLGASRRRLIRQLLTESLVLALAAAGLGFLISRVVLDVLVRTLMSTLAAEYIDDIRFTVPPADWRVALFLVFGAALATVSFGLAPALQATRLDLTRAIRGELTRGVHQSRARTMLIGVQVTASALLLVCAGIFLQSAMASAAVDPGIRTADTMLVEIVNEQTRAAMLQSLATEPSVSAVAASSPDTLSRPRTGFVAPDASGSVRYTTAYRFVSPEYFDVLGVEILQGRNFSAAESDGAVPVAVVSQSLARELWPGADAIGRTLRLDPDAGMEPGGEGAPSLPGRTFAVIGVMRDVRGFRLSDFKEPEIYLPTSVGHAKTTLTARVKGDPDQVRRTLLQRLTTIDPNMGLIVTMKAIARLETYFLQIAFWLTLVLGALALALTLSGLFSVQSYLVEQRRREIGVRMALGATPRNIARLVLGQMLRPVAVGLAAGAGLAVALGLLLMSTPAAEKIGSIVHVFDPMAYVVSVAYIVVACIAATLVPILRATRIDPIATIRQD